MRGVSGENGDPPKVPSHGTTPSVSDLAYQGAGLWPAIGIKRRPQRELTPAGKSHNQALAAA